jgi:hypothetical protein
MIRALGALASWLGSKATTEPSAKNPAKKQTASRKRVPVADAADAADEETLETTTTEPSDKNPAKKQTASRKRVPVANAADAADEETLETLYKKLDGLNEFISQYNDHLKELVKDIKKESEIEKLINEYRGMVTKIKNKIELAVYHLKIKKKDMSKENQEKLWILEWDIYQFNLNNGYPAQHPDQHFPHVGHLGTTTKQVDSWGGRKKRFKKRKTRK